MEKIEEIYINFGIASFAKIEMTKLAKITSLNFSHDVFTKMLLQDDTYNEKKLRKEVKTFLRNYENENDGCIVIDDTILNMIN